MIDRDHELSITRQARLLNISRGTVYYLPLPVSPADLALMRKIDALHLEHPFMGARMLRDQLARQGIHAGRRHIRTLMYRMGIEALAPQPGTSKAAPGHKIYPYLLRKLAITRANQVWALDTTYIPMGRGFVYLTAVVDVLSRKVLAHKVAITLEACHAREVIEQAFARYGTPEIVNTDQGSQFTAEEFTRVVLDQGCKLSMDGRGAWRDNVFVERLWRSLKYEEVHLKAYADGREARAGIASWVAFYNRASEHPSGYVMEKKRLCWSGCDPAGYFGFCRARSVIDWAADVVRAARAKIQGPSGKGWIASISPASAARRSVFGAILRSCAAFLRFNQGSIPSSAGLNTGIG